MLLGKHSPLVLRWCRGFFDIFSRSDRRRAARRRCAPVLTSTANLRRPVLGVCPRNISVSKKLADELKGFCRQKSSGSRTAALATRQPGEMTNEVVFRYCPGCLAGGFTQCRAGTF